MNDIRGRINAHQLELEKLQEEQRKWEALLPEQRVAEEIHELLCNWNHTDGCGWFYGSWNSMGHPRGEYLKKAKAVLQVVDGDEAKAHAVISAFRV